MFNSTLLRLLAVCTALSIVLGLASAQWTVVANLGWAIGTSISILGGILYGRKGVAIRQAAMGGALIGGISIAIGCLLSYVIRSMPIEGVIAATIVGFFTGCIAGVLTSTICPKDKLSQLVAWAPRHATWPLQKDSARG